MGSDKSIPAVAVCFLFGVCSHGKSGSSEKSVVLCVHVVVVRSRRNAGETTSAAVCPSVEGANCSATRKDQCCTSAKVSLAMSSSSSVGTTTTLTRLSGVEMICSSPKLARFTS